MIRDEKGNWKKNSIHVSKQIRDALLPIVQNNLNLDGEFTPEDLYYLAASACEELCLQRLRELKRESKEVE